MRIAQTRFLALDSWRGIAALLVALYHLNAFGHFYPLPLVRNSWLLVDFFFVLSGFVISYSSYDRLSTPSAVLPFVIKRFGRVWPLHAVMLAAFIAFPLCEWLGCYITKLCGTEWPFNPEDDNVRTVLSNLLLIQSLGLHNSLTWNGPSWSISTEFYTYILFALVVVTCRAVLVPIAFVLATCCVVVIMLYSPRYMETSYDFGYFRCVFGFFTGFLIFRLYMSKRLVLGRFGTLLEAGAAGLVFGFLSVVESPRTAIVSPLIFATCVYVFAHQAGAISRLLKTTPFLKLGEWSYSIYMVHAFILIVLLRVVRVAEKVLDLPIRVSMAGYFQRLYFIHDMYLMDIMAVVYLLVVIGVARITYRCVEDPARGFFNAVAKKYDPRSTERRTAAASSSNGT
jgi:peptidoglycan/LPS O-acetylase OafA/YrhL